MKKTLPIILVFLLALALNGQLLAQELTPQDTSVIIKVEKLSGDINSQYDEIMPVLSNDGKQLFFTRVGSDDFVHTLYFMGKDLFWEMPYNMYIRSLRKTYEQIFGTNVSNPIHSKYNQDIWVADLLKDGSIGKVTNLTYPANNALPNSLCAATPNPDVYVVMNQFFPKGGMQGGFSIIRKKPNGGWTFPEPIEIEGFNITGQEINLNLSKDGTVMLLSMNRPDSKGLQDIYVSFLEPSGKWSYPLNLGNQVNSPWKESSPYLASDNKTLFFVSNKSDIYGGTNIYSTVRLDDTWQHWSKPIILTRPVNSHFDESHPVFDFEDSMLFFSSNRDGNSNIYRVKIELKTFDLTTPEEDYVALEGHVLDQNGWLVPGAKIMYRAYNYEQYKEVAVAEDGTFSIRVPKGRKIHLVAKMDGYKGKPKHLFYRKDYLYFKAQFTTLEMEESPEQILAAASSGKTSMHQPLNEISEIKASKKEPPHKKQKKTLGRKKRKGKKIELRPIYFQRSTDHILTKSYPELNRLARLLKKYPTMHIRVEGHTDSNGKPKALLKLSKDRATAIKAYLVNRGIEEDRIESVGFGSQFPVVENTSEYNRRKNRRVEVYITNEVEGLEVSNLNLKKGNRKKR